MIIKNTAGFTLFVGFIDHGFFLEPNETKIVEEAVVENETFQNMENLGYLTILSFETDPTRLAVRQELDSVLLDHESRIVTLEGTIGADYIIDEFTGESLSPGDTFANNLSKTPVDENEVLLYINGKQETGITVSGKTVTWDISNLYSIEPSDEITFIYFS